MKPLVANNKPVKVSLAEGEAYAFGTCGWSSQQPFCDDSHVGTDFKPQQLVADAARDCRVSDHLFTVV